MKRTLVTVLSSFFVLCFAVSAWAAPPIRVDCSKEGSINKTLTRLAQSGNTRGVTISVTGTCKENITITGFDHLVLQGTPTATLQDASNGNDPVVGIYSSYDVTLQNFNITGGAYGVGCFGDSRCILIRNTVQGAGADGVILEGSSAVLQDSNLLNNGLAGVRVENGSKLSTISNTISNNGIEGIVVSGSKSYLATRDNTIVGNSFGIHAFGGSGVRTHGDTISGNLSDGVLLESGSTASFQPGDTGNVITGNGGNGVALHDLSFARFVGTNNVSGIASQPDVACYPQYSATRGAGTVGGTTNCNEPSSPAQKK
jgi:parallel beta-helix repeat protein